MPTFILVIGFNVKYYQFISWLIIAWYWPITDHYQCMMSGMQWERSRDHNDEKDVQVHFFLSLNSKWSFFFQCTDVLLNNEVYHQNLNDHVFITYLSHRCGITTSVQTIGVYRSIKEKLKSQLWSEKNNIIMEKHSTRHQSEETILSSYFDNSVFLTSLLTRWQILWVTFSDATLRSSTK